MFEQVNQLIFRRLWPNGVQRSDHPGLPLSVARYLYALGRDLLAGELSLRAMSLVYTTMIAVVPLLAFSFSVLKGFGYHRELEPFLGNLLAPLGTQGAELTDNIIGFVENLRTTALAGVSLGLLLFSVLSMAQKVEYSFNYVWRVDRPRSLARRFSEYLSVMLVGPVLMTVALSIIGSFTSTALVQKLQAIEPVGSGMLLMGQLTPYLLVMLAFTFLYAFVPNTKVTGKAAFASGIAAGLVWVLGGSLFAQFVVAATRMEAIYSGFAIVIVTMFWLYLSWLVLLLGAQFGFYIQHPDYLAVGKRTPYMSTELTEGLALTAMLLVAKDFFEGGHGWRPEGIAAHSGLRAHQVEPVIESLRRDKLLIETSDGRLVPGRALSAMKVSDVLAAVRSPSDGPQLSWPSPIDEIGRKIDGAIDTALANQSLQDLIEEP